LLGIGIAFFPSIAGIGIGIGIALKPISIFDNYNYS
jgi:hypothetical protein